MKNVSLAAMPNIFATGFCAAMAIVTAFNGSWFWIINAMLCLINTGFVIYWIKKDKP